MKILTTAIATAALALTAMPETSEAGAKKYRSAGKTYHQRSHRKHFSRRDLDRLPIRITRPSGSARYQFQDYPLWAAKAFEPRRNN